ncbi:WXG100 family type VII secretion target [Kitasatospora griseola]|uniref:WXG100 family type VII secretion target n=1 Tax=Kitasatospora griseola TaxID=2064 RepID=UPI00342DB646
MRGGRSGGGGGRTSTGGSSSHGGSTGNHGGQSGSTGNHGGQSGPPPQPHVPQQQQPHVPAQPQQPPHTGQQPQPHVPAQPQQPPHNGQQQPQHPTDDGGDGADGVGPIDPRENWFKGKLKDSAGTVIDSVSQRAGDWAADKLFGPKDPENPEPGGGAAPSTELDGAGEGGGEGGGDVAGLGGMLGRVAGQVGAEAAGGGWGDTGTGRIMIGRGSLPPGLSLDGPSDAYAWAHARVEQAMANLDPAQHPDRGGLGGMLDEAVEWALEQSGLLGMLEKVTGNLAELNAAAEEWQAQAHAVQSVASELRGGAVPLSQGWAGSASDAFGGHMGEVADALDQTAKGMEQTARIINSAAQECAMAEGMIIEIISEAIESLIESLAAEAVIAVVTMGVGLIADALITEAQIARFVAKVAKVSTELARKLEELLKALKELGSAVKAVRNLEGISKALTKVKDVKTAFNGLRELEQGEGKIAQAAQKLDAKASEWAEGKLREGLGIEDGDPVQRGDGTLKGSLKAAGQSSWAVAKEGLTSDVNKEAVKQELLHDAGLAHDPAPYRVDESRIATAFG